MKYLLIILLFLTQNAMLAQNQSNKYSESWESVTKVESEPEWLKDAKFGIYCHWGPSTYPISLCEDVAGWYPNIMYDKTRHTFEFHKKTFGDQHKVGYKDLIPLFKAENFNAKEWASIFKKSGAKFAGPVAVHHDNFCMWNSEVTPYNAMNMGPHRDIVGELAKAIRAEGMRFFTSMHHSYTWKYYLKAFQYDAKDPKYQDLYGEPHTSKDKPSEKFLTTWFEKIKELTDNYKPDLLYFDWGLGMLPEQDRLKMVAYTYNQADKEKRDYTIVYKRKDLHTGSGLYDYEVHYPMTKQDNLWMTDLSVTCWFPFKYAKFESTNTLIDRLIDIVSKNGVLVLNIPPDYTGRIPKRSKAILKEIGEWLSVNGEAIYNTRPWTIYGYGPYEKIDPKIATKAGWTENIPSPFTAEDIRFTISKDHKNLYVSFLDLPKSRVCRITHIGSIINSISNIELLGYKKRLKWKRDGNDIIITYPEKNKFNKAAVFKLSM